MKKLTIGRGDDCDIYVSDPKGLVSRKHAILKIENTGGMQITDVSKNGTFINGVRIPAHVPQKVKRNDVVIFANSSKLDWNDVPDTGRWMRIGIMAAAGLLVFLLALFAASKFMGGKENDTEVSEPLPAVMSSAPETPSGSEVATEEPIRQLEPEVTPSKSKPLLRADEPKSRKKPKTEVKPESEKTEAQQEVTTPDKENAKTDTKAPGGD